jgi:hypothetical protein
LDEKASDPVVACQIDKCYASMLHFLNKYPDAEKGLLANANAGGENVARGVVMGAIYGFAAGVKGLAGLEKGLTEAVAVLSEAEALAAVAS